jgi:hypothetical protein
MKYEETPCLGSLDEWDIGQCHPMDAKQQANYLCFTRQRRIGLPTRCSFFKQDQDEAKIKTMGQLK